MSGRIVRPDKPVGLALPRVGLLKTGFKDARGYPKSVDYFIPTGNYSSYFTAAYSEKPRVIQVVFIDDDPEKVCDERYELRDAGGKLFAKGDGRNFDVWNKDLEKYVQVSIEEVPNVMDAALKKSGSKKGWEVTLTLRFIVPKINGVLGYWQLSTKGASSSIPVIRDTFDEVMKVKGFVRGIIFDLSVEFATSQKPGSASKYPVISLVPNHSKENVAMVQKHVIGFSSEGPKLLE